MDKLPNHAKEGIKEGTQEVSHAVEPPKKEAFSVDAVNARSHVDRMIHDMVEQTLDSLLDAEAERL